MTCRLILKAAAACLLCAGPAKALDADLISAAKTVLSGIQIDSFISEREHCGMIGRNKKGHLVITHPRAGTASSCRPRGLSRLNGRVNELASYHTHGAHDPRMDAEVPSLDDLRADEYDEVIGFVSTPGGRLWIIEPEHDRVRLLCGPGCMPVDANYDPADTGKVRNSYTSKQLVERAREMAQ